MNSSAQSVIFIVIRLLRPDRNNFGSLSVLMSISGVVLGVAALVVVMSTMDGFEKEVRSYAIDISSHGILFDRKGRINKWKPLQAQIIKTPSRSVPKRGKKQKKILLPGRVGMTNLGNTCYINSVFQALSHTKAFWKYFSKYYITFNIPLFTVNT